MRMLTGRSHPDFNLDGGMPQGIKTVVRAARDPMASEPTEPAIRDLLQRTLTRAKLSEDRTGWEIQSVSGKAVMIPLGATTELWTSTCEKLLEEAMSDDT